MKRLEYAHFKIRLEGGTAVLTIDRPEARNAMDDKCWRDLLDFVDVCDHSIEVRTIVITGAGEKVFISGADLKSICGQTYEESAHGYAAQAIHQIESCTKPIIAAINGLALGGGFELALACDFRILSERAKFGFPETGLGLIPGLGGTQKLPRMIGIGRAKEVILADRLIGAAEAVELGLAYKVVAPESLLHETLEFAKRLERKSPAALNYAKKAINASASSDPRTGMVLEDLGFDALLHLEDTAEGIHAFLEKRQPIFYGR